MEPEMSKRHPAEHRIERRQTLGQSEKGDNERRDRFEVPVAGLPADTSVHIQSP